MDELFEAVCPALCACWLVPFAVVGGLVILIESVATGWRWRGLDRKGLFCRRCRFDLRGASERRCAECGAGLDLWGVLAPGIDPPLNVVSRVLLATIGCIGPLVLAGVLLAMVMPFNYTTDRTLTLWLSGETSGGTRPAITLHSYNERSLWGKGRPSAVYFTLMRWDEGAAASQRWGAVDLVDSRQYGVPLPEDDAAVVTDARWARVCGQYQLPDDPAELAERRSELVEAMRYMAGSRGGPPKLQWYRYSETRASRFDPLGVFFVVELMLGLVVWGLLVRWVVVAHGRAVQAYAMNQQRAVRKLDVWIAQNRERAGLGEE
jgi:hypothetical protein